MSEKNIENLFSFTAHSTAYTHPILAAGKRDYKPELWIKMVKNDVSIDEKTDSFIFDLGYDLNSKDLQKYIEDGSAVPAFTIRCDRTSFAGLYPIAKGCTEVQISLHTSELFERVIVGCVLIASADMDDFFCPNDWNKEMVDLKTKFKIKKGDHLAFTEEFRFDIFEELGDSDAIGTIVTVSSNTQTDDEIEILYNSDKIQLYLRKDLVSVYNQLGKTYADYTLAGYIQPVLVEALEKLRSKQTRDQYENYRWAEVMKNSIEKVSEKNFDDCSQISSYVLISKVFGNISNRSGEMLLNLLERNSQEEEYTA